MTYIDLFIDNSSRKGSDIIPMFTGNEKCEPLHSFGPSIRDCWLLHYCVSGKGVFYARGGRYEVSEGEVFIIRPGELTTYVADAREPWHYIWIGFDGKDAKRLETCAPVVGYAADTFLRMAEYFGAGVRTPDIYISLIYEIFHNLLSEERKVYDVTKQVKDYIRLNYMEEITVERIAENTGLNRRYLSRIFKEKYGVTIKEYIISVRCRKAAEFLTAGYSVNEAAFMAGYQDPFAFSKIFRKVMGTPPSNYKTSAK